MCSLLESVLNDLSMLPKRDGQKVASALEKLGAIQFFQGVIERLLERPANDNTQQEFYSGKKIPNDKK